MKILFGRKVPASIAIIRLFCISLCLNLLSLSTESSAQTADVSDAAHIAAPPDDMFIDVQVPAYQIYLGETIRVEYSVYVASQRGEVFYEVREPEFTQWYTFEGKASPIGHASISGKSYQKEPFAVYYLSSYTLGKIWLPPMQAEIPYAEGKPWITHSAPFIEVIPLPQPSPVHFYPGNVGQFQISAELSSRKLRTGESVTAQITVTSDAPAPRIELAPYPADKYSGSLKIYPLERKELLESEIQGKFVSSVKYSLKILPLRAGRYALAPVEIVIFDTSEHKYRTLSATLPEIEAEGADAAPLQESTQIHSSRLDRSQLRPMTPTRQWKLPAVSLWFLLAAPVILISLIIGEKLTKRRRQSHAAQIRQAEIAAQLESFRSAATAQAQLDTLKNLIYRPCGLSFNHPPHKTAPFLEKIFSSDDAQKLSRYIEMLDQLQYSTHSPLGAEETQAVYEILQRSPLSEYSAEEDAKIQNAQ